MGDSHSWHQTIPPHRKPTTPLTPRNTGNPLSQRKLPGLSLHRFSQPLLLTWKYNGPLWVRSPGLPFATQIIRKVQPSLQCTNTISPDPLFHLNPFPQPALLVSYSSFLCFWNMASSSHLCAWLKHLPPAWSLSGDVPLTPYGPLSRWKGLPLFCSARTWPWASGCLLRECFLNWAH